MNRALSKLIGNYVQNDQVKLPRFLFQNYVGIEIECYSHCNQRDVYAEALENDLEEYINVGDDNSIDPFGEENTYEIRLLIPEYKLAEVLPKFGKMFRKLKLKTNDTCGLHVHIDCRTRKFEDVVKRFEKFQNVLFAVVNQKRWGNEYCRFRSVHNRNNKYTAINTNSYVRYKTIEIRLHQGTTNTADIYNWISLLLKIADSKVLKAVKKKQDILTWKSLDPMMKAYLEKRFKESWFDREQREKVMRRCSNY